jgi:hypothetical protein
MLLARGASRQSSAPMRLRMFLGLLWTALLLATGCGHPATVAECEQIIERIARLELEERGLDAKAVADEVESTKLAMRDRTMKECVGRRITDGALRCVRDAKRSEQIEECFD